MKEKKKNIWRRKMENEKEKNNWKKEYTFFAGKRRRRRGTGKKK